MPARMVTNSRDQPHSCEDRGSSECEGWRGRTWREADVSEEKGEQCLCDQAAPGGGGGRRAEAELRHQEWPWTERSMDRSPWAGTLAQLSNNHFFICISQRNGRCSNTLGGANTHKSFHCQKMNDRNTEEGDLEGKFSGIKMFTGVSVAHLQCC